MLFFWFSVLYLLFGCQKHIFLETLFLGAQAMQAPLSLWFLDRGVGRIAKYFFDYEFFGIFWNHLESNRILWSPLEYFGVLLRSIFGGIRLCFFSRTYTSTLNFLFDLWEPFSANHSTLDKILYSIIALHNVWITILIQKKWLSSYYPCRLFAPRDHFCTKSIKPPDCRHLVIFMEL